MAKPLVDAKPSGHYLKEKVAGPERYIHTRGRQMSELRKENNRLFGRLLNIYEVSSSSHLYIHLNVWVLISLFFFVKKKPNGVRNHKPGSLSVTKNKVENAKISQENLVLGAKLIKTTSDVPD